MKALSTLYILGAMALIWFVFGQGPCALVLALLAGAGLSSCFFGISRNVEIIKKQNASLRILCDYEEQQRRRTERLRHEGVEVPFYFRTPEQMEKTGLSDPRD